MLGVAPGTVKLEFAPLRGAHLVGSVESGTALSTEAIADVAIELPSQCFREKDYLDQRYTAKRALYLAKLAAALQKASGDVRSESLGLSFIDGDVRSPCLVLQPSLPGCPKVRLIPSLAEDVFPASKLHPGRSNLRVESDEAGARPASPHYSNSVERDASVLGSARFVQKACASFSGLRVAIFLVKIWFQRRGLLGPDSLSGHAVAVLVTHLFRTGKILKTMAPLALFKAALSALAEPNAFERGFFCGEVDQATPSSAEAGAWRAAFAAVVLSPDGRTNLASGMSPASLSDFRLEAAHTLACLRAGARDAFERAFLSQCDLLGCRADIHLCITYTPCTSEEGLAHADVPWWTAAEREAEAALATGLTERIRFVRALRRLPVTAKAAKKKPFAGDFNIVKDEVTAGAVIDPQHAFRLVDIGPNTGGDRKSPLAKAFRAFWGDRAELRRFKDGVIADAVVWNIEPAKRHLLPSLIVETVLSRHSARFKGITSTTGRFDSLLEPADGRLGEGPVALMGALDRLAARLKKLGSLPLKIVAVQPISESFRGMAAFPPRPHPLLGSDNVPLKQLAADRSTVVPACVDTLEAMVTLEGSARWPLDPVALRRAKEAFVVRVAESLVGEFGMRAHAGRGATLDCFFEGLAFRLHVLTEAEAQVEDAPIVHRVSHAAQLAMLRGLHPTVGPAAALAKRWVGLQLLSTHIPEEAVELLVAHGYLSPSGAFAPSTREAGFLSFLRTLATHPWGQEPLVIDMTAAEKPGLGTEAGIALEREADQALRRARSASAGAPPLFIATTSDPASLFTASHPTAPVLHRLVRLARKTLTLAEPISEDLNRTFNELSDAGELCVPSLADYDLLLLLRPSALPHPEQTAAPAPRKRKRASKDGGLSLAALPRKVLLQGIGPARDALLVGFDPVEMLLEALRARYGHLALFFHDANGGDAVAAVFKPQFRNLPADGLPFKVALAHCTEPISASGTRPNLRALVSEMSAVGEGLVEDVLVLRALE
mmetsp:Transcript_17344/g.56764  ORF Transcript_17344/g.56764 Transcript_17344/m.56764 type:complete len:1002 (+) Transcript_17344:276-3281(+)